ncbi:unnamed protein product [Ixodes hexagonus]
MAKEMYREVDGYYISSGFHEECVRSAMGYKPVPGDVFIVSYPKCGTTWMQHIVYNIFKGRAPPSDIMDTFTEMPFLEMQGAESAEQMPRPGAIKTHMPFRFQPFSKDAKYIYITRNPYDCCVSFFYHTKGMPEYQFTDGTFDEFFEMFIDGKADFGDYFDHLLSWYKHRNDPSVFFLTYEDLKRDTTSWVLKVADFLGEEYGKKLRADQRALEQVLKKTNVGSMKQDVNKGLESFFDVVMAIPEDKRPRWLNLTVAAMGEETLKKPMMTDFVRKGVVGDWKSHFSAEQVRRLKERIASKTRGSDVMDLWKEIDLPLPKSTRYEKLPTKCFFCVILLRSSLLPGVEQKPPSRYLNVPQPPRSLVRALGFLEFLMSCDIYRDVDGFYVCRFFHENNVRSAMAYRPRPGDVFVTSYPKCGTTWVQHIVHAIFTGSSLKKDMKEFMAKSPFLELQGATSAEKMERPGSIKTHLPFHLIPRSTEAKYIYVTRNLYDCCVSFYHHTKGFPVYEFEDGTFDRFFEMFIDGKADTGNYFDHQLPWYEHRNDTNVLMVTYENLKREPGPSTLSIADFLGGVYGKALRQNPDKLKTLLEVTSVDYMKGWNSAFREWTRNIDEMPVENDRGGLGLLRKTLGDVLKKTPTGEFIRKGIVGDWRNHFNEDQIARMKQWIARKTMNSDFMSLWKDIELP